jgi:cbb3-type cytochrome oxidase subunit 1
MATHAPVGHEKIETNNFLMIVLILLALLFGGLLYLAGMLIMGWNTIKTATAGKYEPVPVPPVAAHA